jgi:hypothetical protein
MLNVWFVEQKPAQTAAFGYNYGKEDQIMSLCLSLT